MHYIGICLQKTASYIYTRFLDLYKAIINVFPVSTEAVAIYTARMDLYGSSMHAQYKSLSVNIAIAICMHGSINCSNELRHGKKRKLRSTVLAIF